MILQVLINLKGDTIENEIESEVSAEQTAYAWMAFLRAVQLLTVIKRVNFQEWSRDDISVEHRVVAIYELSIILHLLNLSSPQIDSFIFWAILIALSC